MTIKIKNVSIKNFLSFGNQTQAVNLESNQLTLILGENLDLGGDSSGSRNGVGKSGMLNAVSYALYGQALTNIKKDNLINKINNKNMLVTLEFEKNNIIYRIERGRKPNLLKLYVNDQEQKTEEDEDDSQGDSRETQKSIEEILEMSHTMFKHLVSLNTYTEPFLSMKAADQREVIEQLLGITLLSKKAEALKIQVKETKDLIQAEQIKIEAIKSANENIQKSIRSLELKSSAWESKKQEDIISFEKAIKSLNRVDIDQELQLHKDVKVWNEKDSKLKELIRHKAMVESALGQAEKTSKKYQKEIEKLKNNKCPTCDQKINNHSHEQMIQVATKHLNESTEYFEKTQQELLEIEKNITNIGTLSKKPSTFYETELEASDHKNNLTQLEKSLLIRIEEKNPYDEQIEELKTGAIQEISWQNINDLSLLKDHQEFLIKLLTNKDSFIRKRIIDQNLSYLNNRLSHYIDKLGLPHRVIFQNDLSVEITQLGQDLDPGNLSRGETTRLILALSCSFRDIWEHLYHSINILFIDELLDNGLDSAGVENALSVLKQMGRDRNKNVWMVSHREDLQARVDSVLKVVKSGGFTEFFS